VGWNGTFLELKGADHPELRVKVEQLGGRHGVKGVVNMQNQCPLTPRDDTNRVRGGP